MCTIYKRYIHRKITHPSPINHHPIPITCHILSLQLRCLQCFSFSKNPRTTRHDLDARATWPWLVGVSQTHRFCMSLQQLRPPWWRAKIGKWRSDGAPTAFIGLTMASLGRGIDQIRSWGSWGCKSGCSCSRAFTTRCISHIHSPCPGMVVIQKLLR